MIRVLIFLWRASRGYRLAPWRSPYLRWRMETYWGMHANDIDRPLFWRFLWEHRHEMWQFLRWAGKMAR